jgi:chromate transport protein ChrA
MGKDGKIREVLSWAGIILFLAVFLFLLQWPLTRPWVIAASAVLVAWRVVHLGYQLVRRRKGFDRATLESLAMSGGGMCLIANMQWDRPMLALVGCLLMFGATARTWHEQRRVPDSSGPIAN